MGWKTERWLRDVFPGPDKIYSEYSSLPRRELVIVAGAVLDSALAELLSQRLTGPEREIHSFLGVDGDGLAPCGSFGARIQLALLLGIITQNDALILRLIKKLRNKFAHEVKADFTSPKVLPTVLAIHDQFLKQSNELIRTGVPAGPKHSLELIRPYLGKAPEAGAGLILAILSVYQAYFHQLVALSTPVPPINAKNRA